MRVRGAAIAVVLAAYVFPVPVAADETREVEALTVYRAGFALVEETRVRTPVADGRIRVTGVPVELIADSVVVEPKPPLSITEVAFLEPRLSAATLLARHRGRMVTVYRRTQKDGDEVPLRVRLLAVDGAVDGDGIFATDDGVALGLPGRIVVDRVPDDLVAEPTLLLQVRDDTATVGDFDLSYLTEGVAWRADTVALLDENGERLSLQTRAILENTTDVAYAPARVSLVAGDVQRLSSGPRPMQAFARTKAMFAEAGDVEGAGEETDYHVYDVTRPIALPRGGRTQIELFRFDDLGATRRYLAEHVFPYQPIPRAQSPRHHAASELVIEADARPTQPIPAGIVRVYQRRTRAPDLFLGEDRIGDIPVGEPLRLRTGRAFDVLWQVYTEEFRTFGRDEMEAVLVFAVHNRRREPTAVVFTERFRSEFEIVDASLDVERADAASFVLALGAAENARAEARVRVRVQR